MCAAGCIQAPVAYTPVAVAHAPPGEKGARVYRRFPDNSPHGCALAVFQSSLDSTGGRENYILVTR